MLFSVALHPMIGDALLTTREAISMVEAFRATGAGGPSTNAKETANERRLSTLVDVTTGVSAFIVNDPSFHYINWLLFF